MRTIIIFHEEPGTTKFIQIALLAGLAGTLFAAEPLSGTWKLNPSRSSGVIPADETVSVQVHRGMLLIEVAVRDGGPAHSSFEIAYSVPAAGGTGHVEKGPYDSVVMKRVGVSALEITYLTGGSEARSTRVVVSKNGRTMTSTGAVIGSGEPSAWTMVFDKQRPAR